MTPPILIYAKSSDDEFFKLIVGVIVFAFWAIGGIASAMKKRTDAQKRPAMVKRPSAADTQFARQPKYPSPKRIKRNQARVPVQTPFATAAPAYLPPASAPTPPPPIAAAKPKPAAAPAGQIARLLRRPDSLRAAIILNEVLSPPLSLRQNAGGGPTV